MSIWKLLKILKKERDYQYETWAKYDLYWDRYHLGYLIDKDGLPFEIRGIKQLDNNGKCRVALVEWTKYVGTCSLELDVKSVRDWKYVKSIV